MSRVRPQEPKQYQQNVDGMAKWEPVNERMSEPRLVNFIARCEEYYAAHIANRDSLHRKISLMHRNGAKKLQVISDFAYTFTKFRNLDQKRAHECHAVIEHSTFMPDEFRTEYKQIWTDKAKKSGTGQWSPEMWWYQTHALMVKYRLRKNWVNESVRVDSIALSLSGSSEEVCKTRTF